MDSLKQLGSVIERVTPSVAFNTGIVWYCDSKSAFLRGTDGFKMWCYAYLDNVFCLTLSHFTLYLSLLIISFSHRCPPTPLLGGSRVCERWEEVCCAVPVSGPAVSIQQRVHSDSRGAMGLQVVLPRPHTGFLQLPRQPEWWNGWRRSDEWDRRSRWRVRGWDASELPRLRWQRSDGPNCGVHLWFLCYAVRVLQEQRHLHNKQ